MYSKVDFKEVIRTEGDSWARYLIRMDEIMESLNIIEQLIDNIPEGNYQEKMKPIIRVPEGNYYAAVEAAAVNSEYSSKAMATKCPTACISAVRGFHWYLP